MTSAPSLADLQQQLSQFTADPAMHDDAQGVHCCRLALRALQQGSYGVAAMLLGPGGEVLAEAANGVFSEGYRSDGHAEMLLVDRLERGARPYPLEQLTMLVSLEPCPMCLGRLLLSGIGTIRYMATDPDGGMLSRIDKLPPAWRNLAQLQNHYPAHISSELRRLAEQLAASDLAHLRHKLFTCIRP